MLYDSLIDTAKTSAMVFIILFGASAFTGILMSLDGDQLIATWISSVGIGKWGAFAIMMAIVFFMGMFLDWLGIVMIVFPIFLPIMDMFGFDRLCSLFGGPAVAGGRQRHAAADLLHDAAVRLRTVLHQGHCAAVGQNTGNLPRRYPVHPDYHRSGNSGNGIPAGCIFPPESGSILIFLLSLPAATCAGRLICLLPVLFRSSMRFSSYRITVKWEICRCV